MYNQSTRQWGNRYKQRNRICRKLEIPTGYGPMHYAPYAPEGQERYLGANVHDRGVRKQYDGPVERGQSGNKQEWWRQVEWPAGCCSRENINERERERQWWEQVDRPTDCVSQVMINRRDVEAFVPVCEQKYETADDDFNWEWKKHLFVDSNNFACLFHDEDDLSTPVGLVVEQSEACLEIVVECEVAQHISFVVKTEKEKVVCAQEVKSGSPLVKSFLCRKAVDGPPGLMRPDFSLTNPDVTSLWPSLASNELQRHSESTLLHAEKLVGYFSDEMLPFVIGALQALGSFQTAMQVSLLVLFHFGVFVRVGVEPPWFHDVFVFIARLNFVVGPLRGQVSWKLKFVGKSEVSLHFSNFNLSIYNSPTQIVHFSTQFTNPQFQSIFSSTSPTLGSTQQSPYLIQLYIFV